MSLGANGYLADYLNSISGLERIEVNRSFSHLLPDVIRGLARRSSLKARTLGNSLYAGVFGVSWSDQAIHQSGPSLSWVSNGGVASDTTAMMLARIATAVPDGDICIFGEGPNDSGSLTVKQHRENLEAIILYCLNKGILPVLIASSFSNSNSAIITSFYASEIALAEKYGITIIDPWINFIDTSTGSWVSGSNADQVHPTALTSRAAAIEFAKSVNGTIPPTPFAPRSNISGTSGYLISGGNCFNLLDANSDGVPDGWGKAGTATASLIDAPSGFRGKFAEIKGAAASGNPYLRKIITTGWQTGDEILLSFAVQSTLGNSGSVAISVTYDTSTSVNILPSSTIAMSAQRKLVKFRPTTTSQIEIYFRIDGSGTDNSLSFGEFEAYNLTALLNR